SRMLPRHLLEPPVMTLGPVPTGRERDAVAQQQLADTLADAKQILAGIVARPTQIADCLRGWGRWGYFGEEPGAKQLGEFSRVATIRFHAIAGFLRNHRRGNHSTLHTAAGQPSLQRVARRTGFVTAGDHAWRRAFEFALEPLDRRRLGRTRPLHRL